MKKIIKHKRAPEEADSVAPQAEADLAGLINKVSEQLASLERKVDSLINRHSEHPRDGGHFQRPGQHFRHEDRPREKNFTKVICSECGKECEIPFKPTEGRPVFCRDCFSERNDSGPYKGKFDNKSREGGFSRERNFPERGEARLIRPEKKRNPFFQKRKGRS